MNNGKPTEREMGAWLAMLNPTGSWNKYNHILKDGQLLHGKYNKGVGKTQTIEIDSLTKEQFVQLAGFDNWNHYLEVKHYYDNQPIQFNDLRQGMIVWSEALRNRYTILQKRDKDSVYVTQHNPGGWAGTKRYLTRDEIDTGFFKKSKAIQQNIKIQDTSDIEHAKYPEYATD